MNLSERLGLNYPKTSALEKVAKEYHRAYDGMPGNYSYNGIYEYCLELKERQDNGEIIPDIDYANVPSGYGVCGNEYIGYFTVNFHYALFHPETIENVNEFENQLNQFLEECDDNRFDDINIKNTVRYYNENKKQ